MIKQLTVYECKDGKRFDDAESAKQYEMLLNRCNAINSMLGVSKKPIYQRCAVQLDKQTVEFCYEKFIEQCLIVLPDYNYYTLHKGFENFDKHYIHRVIDENYDRYPCLRELSQRFNRISRSTYIEYDQPYFAEHESDFKGKVI